MNSSEFKLTLAVVIGINNYQNGIPVLGTARQDAEAIAEILERDYQYQVHLITDSEATSDNIKRWLETDLPEVMKTANPSRFLFYFAGHGIALNGDEGPEGYLIPQNARLGDVSTYLPMSRVYKALIQLSCRHFLGILDCCFAGAFRWSSTRKLVPIELGTIHKERFDRFIQDPAWQVITSAAHDQTASDSFNLKDDRGQKGGHSPFAAALIEALEGKADAYPVAEPGKPAGDGVITATELYLYLRERVEVATEARSLRQTPGIYPLKKHDKGEYIFLAPGHPLNLPPAPPLDVSNNPYRGLESFDEAHKDLFFGRKALTQQLSEFVATHSLTVVLSASGAGKSSLVKAGLIPTLRQRQEWHLLPPFRPGELPVKALEQAVESLNLSAIDTRATDGSIALDTHAASSDLSAFAQRLAHWFKAHPQSHLLVVVDQFEEIITLCRDEQERQQFLNMLAEAIASYPTQLHLVLTLRSDFEPQFRNTALEQDWQAARFVVPAMTREELRQAIEEPASARVMYFAPHELVDQLIDEVTNMPGALPLLSFALSELYLNYLERQEGARNQGETLDRAITQSDYEELGGVTRSLTQRAEQEYDALVQEDSDYEHTIRNVMLRMVSVGGELARRRVPLSELEYPEPENSRVQIVLERFEKARLLTPGTDSDGQPYQEPAHDALVRGWKRLLNWKQQYLAALILQRELTSDANQWKTSSKKKKDSGLLWIEDPRLPAALHLSCGRAYKDTWINLFKWRFGYQAWQSQPRDCWFNQAESDFVWQSFNQRFQRFGKTTITIAGVILILAVLGVALIASLTRALLALERAAAADQRTAIEAQSQAALRQFDANQTEALATALGAGESLRSLLHKRAKQNGLFGAEKSHSLEHYPTFSPFMALYQILNTIQERQIPVLGGSVQELRWTPDGDIVAIGGNDRTVKLLSPEGALIAEIQANQATVNSLGWTSAGDTLATGGSDGTLKLWTREGVLITEIQANQGEIYSLGWSADRAVLVTSGSDGTLKLWTREGVFITEIQANQGDVNSLAWTAVGTVLATSGSDGTVKIWNQSGEFISVIQADPFDRVISLAWSPDGQTLATGGYNHFRLWTPNGNLIRDVQTSQDWVNSLSWSPDGQTLATGGENGTSKLWNLAGNPIDDVKATQGTIRDLAWDPNGKILAIGGQDGQVKFWSRTNEFNTEIQANQGDYSSLSWTSDGQTLASGGNDGTVKLWSRDGDLMTTLVTQQGRLWSVAWTPDGEILATGGDVGNAKLWQRDGTPIADIPADQGWAFSLSWSADGQTLATTGGTGKTIKLWRRDGTFISEIETQQHIVRTVRWVGHEQLLSTGAEDGTIKLWQTDGTPVQTIQAHDVKVWSMDWSPEGDILAIGADNGRVKLLRQDATAIAEMQAHQGLIWMLTWSPDGQILATSGNDGFIRLWSRSGSLITELQDDQGTIYGLAWSHDGKKLAAGGYHGMVKLWALEDLDTLLAKGCNWLESYLSASSKASNGRAICQNPKAEATQQNISNLLIK